MSSLPWSLWDRVAVVLAAVVVSAASRTALALIVIQPLPVGDHNLSLVPDTDILIADCRVTNIRVFGLNRKNVRVRNCTMEHFPVCLAVSDRERDQRRRVRLRVGAEISASVPR